MWDSETECDAEAFLPAVLRRPKVSNHVVHESFTVDTRDHEDHTFCGIMFDVRCRDRDGGGAPIEFMQINAVSVRGYLGPLTVWTTIDTYRHKEHEEELWELVYEQEHRPSRSNYCQLELSKPVRLTPGQRRGLYVHSKLPGDDAIVYDNERCEITYEDEALQVFPGQAHLSNRPFGRRGMWGYPWRLKREFVGRLHYGVSYKLWNPEVHTHFPAEFRRAVKVCLLCARRPESQLNRLQDDIILYILNMCKYDWFSTSPPPQRHRGRAAVPTAPGADWMAPLTPVQGALVVQPAFRRIWTMVMGSGASPTAHDQWRQRHELLGGIGRGSQRPDVEVSEASDNGGDNVASDSESSSSPSIEQLHTRMTTHGQGCADGAGSGDAHILEGAASSSPVRARQVQGNRAAQAQLQRLGNRRRTHRMVWRPVATSAGEASRSNGTDGAAAPEDAERHSSKGKGKGKVKDRVKGTGKGKGKGKGSSKR